MLHFTCYIFASIEYKPLLVVTGRYGFRKRKGYKRCTATDSSESELLDDDNKYPPRTKRLRIALKNYQSDSDIYEPNDQDKEGDEDSDESLDENRENQCLSNYESKGTPETTSYLF